MSERLNFDIEAVFEELGQIGEDKSGLQRLAFSDHDNQGFEFIKSILQKENISYREDAFGNVVMSVDIRGVNEDSIRRTTRELLEFASGLQGVAVFITRFSEEKPVLLSRDIAGVLTDACREEGVSSMPLQSGAGHDAMYMAKDIPTAMLFVPSVDGVSHNQKEFTPFQDIRNVAQVLTRAIETWPPEFY